MSCLEVAQLYILADDLKEQFEDGKEIGSNYVWFRRTCMYFTDICRLVEGLQ